MEHHTFADKKLDIDTSNFFRLMMENSQVAGILLLDEKGIILDSNSGVQKSFGYCKEEIIGKNFSLLFIPEDRLKNLPEIELTNVLQKGSWMDTNYIQHREGNRIWAHGESIFSRDDNGKAFIIKIIFDINHQKILEKFLISSNEKLNRSEEDLVKKVEQLAKINSDLDTFVYTASHDLKAPISNIEALVTNLFEELTDEINQKKDVKDIREMINNSFNRFKTTLQDLSNIGRAQAEVNKGPVFFAEIIEETKINLRQQIEESGAHFIEDLSKAPSIKFPKSNLKSIIHNLISNAVKYRAPGRKPEIRVSTEPVDGFVLMRVSDNGLGIREEDKAKVFAMYGRLHTHVEGTGVGMGIVARVVNNTGGKIDIESEVGKGSTFNIYLKESV